MAPRKYNVLALDGGGIRGVIPARVLEVLESRMGRPVAELFDLVAGTSTGGILALGLTKPSFEGGPAYSATDMLDLYMKRGDEIFPDSILLKVRTLGGLADPRYPAEPLEALLAERFGDTTLSQALTEIVVPSYDLSAPAPFFFKREYARDEGHNWDVPMALVARATSAAPTYFDPARLPALEQEGDHALIDGGTFANNPAVAAVVDGLRLWGQDAAIQVVSIGTGHPPQVPGHGPIPVAFGSAQGWGLAHWARPILEVVLDGAAKAVEYQMVRLCPPNAGTPSYHRMQSSLPTASHALDDASQENRTALLADADALIHEQAEVLDSICHALAD
ncbi:MAG: patatin-like phospholipase family protein [Actinomycetota bacterium]|nr:patatin-like phospholipase family protein [Actinomycetota bacterium]